jgi:hypothetical protein
LSNYKNVKRFVLNEKSLVKMDVDDIIMTGTTGQVPVWEGSSSQYEPGDPLKYGTDTSASCVFQEGATFGHPDSAALVLNSAGEFRMQGSATVWLDTNIPALGLARGASAPDLVAFLSAGNIQGLGFDGVATTEEVFGSFEVAHGYLEDSTFYPHVHWMPTTSACGVVCWQLEVAHVDDESGAAFPDTVLNYTIESDATGVTWYAKEADFVNSDSTVGAVGLGVKPGSTFIFRLFRDPGAAADTYGADAALINFGVDFEIHRLGEPTRVDPVA